MNSNTPSNELPDDAIVVRGGRNSPSDIARSVYSPKEGVAGIAVLCSPDHSFEELCSRIPHKVVRCTTVGSVRSAGGDVVTSCGKSPEHATLIGVYLSPLGLAPPEALTQVQGAPAMQGETRHQTLGERNVTIYADFNNADTQGRLRLNTRGARADLEHLGVRLVPGMSVVLSDGDELCAAGTVVYDEVEGWVAEIDWDRLACPES